MEKPLVIVGGGPSGLEAARAYRQNRAAGKIVLVSADEHLPYERPPLSKEYLRGESGESDLPIEDADFYDTHGIEVRLRTKVDLLDLHRHLLGISDGTELGYGICILATGATPTKLPVPGADDPGIFSLRSRLDARLLREAASSAHTAVVIGSGFIGCEAAASLRRRGLDVTLVTMEELPQVDRLGRSAGERLRSWLQDEGVVLRLDVDVVGIDECRFVNLSDGTSVEGDLVLVAGGVNPEVSLAQDAGLVVAQNRVQVDTHMRASDPDVLAVGDVALAYNRSAGRPLAVEHWGEALAMGRIAGETAAGREAEWEEVPGFWSTIGERTLKYAAWGDGYDRDHVVGHGEGRFTIWYESNHTLVGVLTHGADDDYDRGKALIERHQAPPYKG